MKKKRKSMPVVIEKLGVSKAIKGIGFSSLFFPNFFLRGGTRQEVFFAINLGKGEFFIWFQYLGTK